MRGRRGRRARGAARGPWRGTRRGSRSGRRRCPPSRAPAPRRARRGRPEPGAATIVSAPLSRQTQPNRSAAAPGGLEPVRVHPVGALAEQPAELARVRRQHRPRAPVARLELVQRVGVEHELLLARSQQLVPERLRGGIAAETGPDRERAGLRSGVDGIRPGQLHGLEQLGLDDRQRLLRARRPRRSRRRRGRRPRRRGRRRRSCQGRRRRRAPPRRCTCCPPPACAGRARGSPASRAGARSPRARARCPRPRPHRRGRDRARLRARACGRGR